MQIRHTLLALAVFCAGCVSPSGVGTNVAVQTTNRPAPLSRPQLLGRECRVLPDYPPASLQNRETGTVRLLFQVDAAGAVTAAQVKSSSGFSALDNAALNTLAKCPFLPAYKDGKPVPGETDVSYVWRIN